jgi:DNA-binding CsgD family transcriptional regulator
MRYNERLQIVIDLIYEAAIQPAAWTEVAEAMSELFDGSAVMIGIGLPADGRIEPHYSSGMLPEFTSGYTEHLLNGLPWKSAYTRFFTDRFGRMDEVFPDVDLSESDFYRSFFEPQDFAAEWPIGHSIAIEGGRVVGGLGIFRRLNNNPRPFDKDDLALGDVLVRHLSRSFVVYTTLGGVRRERLAMGEVMDRLPTGVILLNASREAVVTNQSADRIIAQRDGFRVDAGGPGAANARENALMQKILADVLDAPPGRELQNTGFLAVTRPSGKRAYALMLTPLMAVPVGGQTQDAAAAIFISDPEAGLASASEVLETIYSLTHAEAELVRLLSQGMSLEEAARARGVAIATARSHLKRVFNKTHTKRQGELVRLVLAGVASFGDE